MEFPLCVCRDDDAEAPTDNHTEMHTLPVSGTPDNEQKQTDASVRSKLADDQEQPGATAVTRSFTVINRQPYSAHNVDRACPIVKEPPDRRGFRT